MLAKVGEDLYRDSLGNFSASDNCFLEMLSLRKILNNSGPSAEPWGIPV